MISLIKSLFRYNLKNKASVISLTVLTALATGTFSSLMTLSSNLDNSYTNLVDKGNLNNINIYEKYSTSVNSPPNNQPKFTEQQAIDQNKKNFRSELDKMNIDYREFKSIDYSNAADGKLYKIVETSHDDQINKLVMFDGQRPLEQRYDFGAILDAANWNYDSNHIDPITKMTAAEARRDILYFAATTKWSSTTSSGTVDKSMLNFWNEVKDLKPDNTTTDKSDPKNVKGNFQSKNQLQKWLDPTSNNYLRPIDNTYKISFTKDNLIPSSATFYNLSYAAVTVPPYVLEEHNKQILPKHLYDQYIKLNEKYSEAHHDHFVQWVDTLDPKHILEVDAIKYVITGSGITPDFMYPVYSFAKTVPNVTNEVLIYGNDSAFSVVYDANRSSFIDSYLVAETPDSNLNKIIQEVQDKSLNYMSWPSNLRSTYAFDDTSNIMSPTAMRVIFLPQLVNSQIAISNAMSLFISVLTILVFISAVRKYTNDNKNTFGVLRANGIKKRSIVGSTAFMSIIPTLVGGFLGYLISFVSQNLLLGLYSFYWTIPTAITAFNPLFLLGVIAIPMFFMSALCMGCTYFTMKTNVNKLLTQSSNFKVSNISKVFSTGTSRLGVLTKFRTSVAFASMSKIFIITTMFTLLSSTIAFTSALNGRFEYGRAKTYSTNNYDFGFDLITPTVQGGQYFRSEPDTDGEVYFNDKKEVINYNVTQNDNTYVKDRQQGSLTPKIVKSITKPFSYVEGKGVISNKKYAIDVNGQGNAFAEMVNYHFPSVNDMTFQKNDFNYLTNKVQTQPIIDTEVGMPLMLTNPWNIAKNLMPLNYRNLSLELYKTFWNRILNDDEKKIPKEHGKYFRNFKTNSPVGKTIFDLAIQENVFTLKKTNTPSSINSDRIFKREKDGKEYVLNVEQLTQQELVPGYDVNLKYQTNPAILLSYIIGLESYNDIFFKLFYNYVPMAPADETYTKVDANIVSEGLKSDDNISVIGIQNNSKFVSLENLEGYQVGHKIEEPVINLKTDYQNYNYDTNNTFAVIINESARTKYGIDIGSKIKIKPENSSTRFNPKNDPKINQINNREFTLNVVDIIKSYQWPEFYINQKNANFILNLNDPRILDTSYFKGEFIDPFNGFFTDETNPELVTSSLSLYAIAGLSPSVDKFSNDSFYKNLINASVNSNGQWLNNSDDQYRYLSKLSLMSALGYQPNEETAFDASEFGKDSKLTQDQRTEKIINTLITTYGASPLLSTMNMAVSTTSMSALFENTSDFVHTILVFVAAILIIISLLAVITVSIDLVNSAIPLNASLKALGFTDSTNAYGFLSMFFPAIVISVGLSIPLTIVIINVFKSFIFDFSSILIPMSASWWVFIVPLVSFFILLAFTLACAIYKLKKQKIAKAITRN